MSEPVRHSPTKHTRRALLSAVGAAALALSPAAAACNRASRCKHCGMRVDPASPWRTDLVAPDGTILSFDTPRCAFTSWRSGKTSARGLRAQEYYERKWLPAEELRFVAGGDVLGPMGPDLVPVSPARAGKFIQDHGADRAYELAEVTTEVLTALR